MVGPIVLIPVGTEIPPRAVLARRIECLWVSLPKLFLKPGTNRQSPSAVEYKLPCRITEFFHKGGQNVIGFPDRRELLTALTVFSRARSAGHRRYTPAANIAAELDLDSCSAEIACHAAQRAAQRTGCLGQAC